MRDPRRPAILLVLSLTSLLPSAAAAQQTVTGIATDERVALALSAAPVEIAAAATVIDVEGNILRQGRGAFTCIAVPDAPMCLDAVWMAWFKAYVGGTEPTITGLGISYMLAGDAGASNTDPSATAATEANDWVVSGPHLMLLVPDAHALDSLPTTHDHGGPFVMWKGTPYAHVMVPVPARAR